MEKNNFLKIQGNVISAAHSIIEKIKRHKMKNNLLFTFCLIVFSLQSVFGQNTWTQKADFPAGDRCEMVGFSIGDKGYMCLGLDDNSNPYNDLWEYDTTSNSWTQKSSFAGSARSETISFVLGSKAYIGAGVGAGTHDFWAYDQTTNSWTQKTFWGHWVEDHDGFSIGNKGYICGGWDGIQTIGDLWEYDPDNDSWTQKATFANGLSRWATVSFTIGNYAYMGTGVHDSVVGTTDFWKYDPSVNFWSQVADFPGSPRREAVAFSINGKGYVGTGVINISYNPYFIAYNDFWEYNPSNDLWVQVASLPTSGRVCAGSFSIGNNGYVGTGIDSNNNYLQDFWEFSPPIATNIVDNSRNQTDVEIYPNPATDKIFIKSSEQFSTAIISDINGRDVVTIPLHHKSEIDISDLSSGDYVLQLVNGKKISIVKFNKIK